MKYGDHSDNLKRLSKDSMQRDIDEISLNIDEQLVERWKTFFPSMRADEPRVFDNDLLMAFVCYLNNGVRETPVPSSTSEAETKNEYQGSEKSDEKFTQATRKYSKTGTATKSTIKEAVKLKKKMKKTLYLENWSLHFDGKRIDDQEYQVLVLKNEQL
ncbi:Hypothetical predicted protein [Octopus vulgaris]|uniref:Uncharacterized protein n=1 Tax=Octopus vulgaris TaxID=6645 RepID=A0AA36AMQ9_OCTVU|nr:Hypothetical predicted protein [Octopus vulgaris]